MKPLIWIIDEEWADYEEENKILKTHFPDCTLKYSSLDYEKDLNDFGQDADAIICQVNVKVSRETISKLKKCKVISVFGSGFDQVDVVAAKESGIRVTNVGDYCKEDIADYVMAAVYFFYKNLSQLTSNVKQSHWGAQAVDCPPNRIKGATLHVIGLGRIGAEVAKLAIANGMKVTAFDLRVDEQRMNELGVEKVEWDEGLSHADYVTVHCALTEETTHLIKYSDFLKMKPSAVLINVARGKIIDEEGMCQALQEKRIKGVMLDVVETEPPTYKEKIFDCENAYITPHSSFVSVQSYLTLKRQAAINAIDGLEGHASISSVNGL